MPSRADAQVARARAEGVSADRVLQVAGGVLHAVALASIAVLLWHFLTPSRTPVVTAAVEANGAVGTPLAVLLRSASDTIDVTLDGTPSARARASLRALRGSGRAVRMTSAGPLPALAVTAEEEWRATGGTRIQAVGTDSTAATILDAAGLLDSVRPGGAGARIQAGPVQGALRADGRTVRAATAPLRAGAPVEARLLVLGNATWESRFLIAAFEEAGWSVDAAVTLSPKVTVTQGAMRAPSRDRHAVVVLLPGAPAASVAALPRFVRDGGGLVIVGEAARIAGLGALRAGTPGVTMAGELGAEASATPRHGLDLVPITSLAPGAVVLESRGGRTAVAARRVGAGRVLQVGYDNSWLWRMAGNDDAPVAHRRWWTTMVSSVVTLTAPVPRFTLAAGVDTLDAAPLAALARDVGLPSPGVTSRPVERPTLQARIDPIWLLVAALLSLVASWITRRWRGLA